MIPNSCTHSDSFPSLHFQSLTILLICLRQTKHTSERHCAMHREVGSSIPFGVVFLSSSSDCYWHFRIPLSLPLLKQGQRLRYRRLPECEYTAIAQVFCFQSRSGCCLRLHTTTVTCISELHIGSALHPPNELFQKNIFGILHSCQHPVESATTDNITHIVGHMIINSLRRVLGAVVARSLCITCKAAKGLGFDPPRIHFCLSYI